LVPPASPEISFVLMWINKTATMTIKKMALKTLSNISYKPPKKYDTNFSPL
jgi:hypothetical protein